MRSTRPLSCGWRIRRVHHEAAGLRVLDKGRIQARCILIRRGYDRFQVIRDQDPKNPAEKH
ncbi:MAG TPA: hypothetical protein VF653_20275, partial [Methylomirabilota bacterium]